MPLTVNFDAYQTPGSPENVTFEDLSTGTDGAVSQRRIYVQQTNGSFLVEDGSTLDYSLWPIPLALPITLDLFSKDYGVRVTVQWCDINGAVLYDKTEYYGFACYNEDEGYSLTQNVASNSLLMNDNNFWVYKSLLTELIDSGNKAIERAADINACQQCYDQATSLRLNAQYLFNQNS